MSRPLRIELSGGLYHVTSRGDRREDIYLNDDDRIAWLDILGAVCKRFNWACHAWCQMTNHYHAVIETPEGNLSEGMRQLNGVYTQYVNRTHDRVGHVFQGRYKAILVEKDAYLLELARYVVLNPVRAGMVRRPEQWAWSSYRAMVGRADRPPWLHTDWPLGQFGTRRSRAVEKYVDFVRAGIDLPSIWNGLRNQIYLGSEDFVKRLQRRAPKDADLGEIPRMQRRPIAKSLKAFCRGTGSRSRDGAGLSVGRLHDEADRRALRCPLFDREPERVEAGEGLRSATKLEYTGPLTALAWSLALGHDPEVDY